MLNYVSIFALMLYSTNCHFSFLIISPVVAPVVSVGYTTSTALQLSWTSAGSEVDSYEVMWMRDTSGECLDEDSGISTITDGSTSYNITKAEEDSRYTVTVKASNAAGSAVSVTVTGMTMEAGEVVSDIICGQALKYCLPLKLHLPLQLMSVNRMQLLTVSLSNGNQWVASTAMGTLQAT